MAVVGDPLGVGAACVEGVTVQGDAPVLADGTQIPLEEPPPNNLSRLRLGGQHVGFAETVEHFFEALLIGGDPRAVERGDRD